MNVTRSKMNSTMMVKFNSSTEKNINQRGNLNKSTLLPNNVSNHNAHLGVATIIDGLINCIQMGVMI